MRKIYTLPLFDLQLFSDGAAAGPAAGGDAGAAAQQEGAGTLPKAETKRGHGSSRRARSGEFDNVVFGKQDAAAGANVTTDPAAGGQGEGNAKETGVTTTSDTLEAKRKAFKELVEGEYKDQYTEMFQQAFNRRFKDVKGMEDSLGAQKPIMDMLMQKYQIADGDVAKLQKAIEQDDTYWEKAAEDNGMSIEQYKQFQKFQRDSQELQQLRRRQAGEQQAQQQMAKWYQEAEQMTAKYPGFDFKAECQDRDFLGMLRNGLSVETAYRVKHMDEITEATARAAAKTASEQMAASIKAKAARPAENGTSRQSAAIVKSDVHSLSRAERAEVARRAARGETIKF